MELIGYGPQAAGTGNNLQPVSRTVASGDGSVSATVATAYDAMGNAAAAAVPQGQQPRTGLVGDDQ